MSNGTRGEWLAFDHGMAGSGKAADKLSNDSSPNEPLGDPYDQC